MTIEQKVRDIVDAHLSNFTFVFEDWETADIVIDKVQLPAIIFILPISGSLSFGRYGRIKDAENCAIAFVDKVTRRANGDDNEAVYTQMKQAAKTFLQQVNESGYFEYDTDKLMNYCERELGFKFEYDEKDYYLDDPEDLEEGEEPDIDEDQIEEDKNDAFSEWLSDYVNGLSDKEAKSFFYNHMNADLDLDNVDYSVEIPAAIIKQALG